MPMKWLGKPVRKKSTVSTALIIIIKFKSFLILDFSCGKIFRFVFLKGVLNMKFSCPKDILLNAVTTTAKAAASKSTISALEGVLFELNGNALTITGYDLDIGIRTEIDVNGMENGSTIVNAKIAGDIIRKMPSGEITFTCDTSNMAVIVNRDTEVSIMCMNAEDYPNVPSVNPETSFTMPQKTLKSMINQTKYACSLNDSKPALMGCKFEIDSNVLNVVAVDGIRIALRQEPVVYDNIEFIVPLKSLEELTHILSDESDKEVTLCIDKNQISFLVGNYTMISRLIDGEFISYKKHLEGEKPVCAEVNTREVMEMLDRCMLMINEKNKCPVRCEFSGDTLSISCITALGKVSDKINIKYNGSPIVIGFNAKYLMDAFKAADTDMVKMEMTSSAVSPIIIVPTEGSEFTFLLLPMRLK